MPIRQDQADDLRLARLEDAQVLVIVNKVGDTLTANLQGPIVCNTEVRVAEQLVLAEKRWTTRHPIMTIPAEPAGAESAELAQKIPA